MTNLGMSSCRGAAAPPASWWRPHQPCPPPPSDTNPERPIQQRPEPETQTQTRDDAVAGSAGASSSIPAAGSTFRLSPLASYHHHHRTRAVAADGRTGSTISSGWGHHRRRRAPLPVAVAPHPLSARLIYSAGGGGDGGRSPLPRWRIFSSPFSRFLECGGGTQPQEEQQQQPV